MTNREVAVITKKAIKKFCESKSEYLPQGRLRLPASITLRQACKILRAVNSRNLYGYDVILFTTGRMPALRFGDDASPERDVY